MATFAFAGEQIPQDLINQLIQRREAVKKWALTCGPGPYEGQYSLLDNICWQGDMTCYAGLECLGARLAEDEETADARCGDVSKAQAENGRWHRGPMFVGVEYPGNDFSRDQTRGVFAYLLADGYVSTDETKRAKARDAATRWLNWITENNGRICLDDSKTCDFDAWGGVGNMFYNVYHNLGILDRPHDAITRNFFRSKWYYRWGFNAEIRTLFFEELRGLWYPRHLKASSLLLYRVMNMDPVTHEKKNLNVARRFGEAARRIYNGDPQNPLYRLFYEGVTVDLIQWVLNNFPEEKPIPVGEVHDWSIQRHSTDEVWKRSDGHDQIYLIDLILAKINGKLNW